MQANPDSNNLPLLGLVDEQQKVRTITALALAALAEAATPYGIESFDSVLKPLWKGIRQHRGKVRLEKNVHLGPPQMRQKTVIDLITF